MYEYVLNKLLSALFVFCCICKLYLSDINKFIKTANLVSFYFYFIYLSLCACVDNTEFKNSPLKIKRYRQEHTGFEPAVC